MMGGALKKQTQHILCENNSSSCSSSLMSYINIEKVLMRNTTSVAYQ